MSAADLAAYRADPVWPVRAAAAGTILRELEAEADPAASLDRLGAVRQPVLQLLGCESLPVFRDATRRSTLAWPTAGSSSSRAPGTPPTTPTRMLSSRPSSLPRLMRRGRSARPTPGPSPDVPRTTVLDMGVVGWIVVGFLAGAISGALVGGKTARGCLPNIVVGILGGLLGGWLANAMGFTSVQGFIAAIVVAVFGSLVVRVILGAMSGR